VPQQQHVKRRVGGPSWRPGDPTETVGEIAARLAAISPNFEGTIQRIRHWTREGLMVPADLHHAGTGRHRRYPQTAVFDAAVLHVLTNAGLTTSAVRDLKTTSPERHLVDALTLVRFSVPKWRQQGGPLFLTISQSGTRTEIEVIEQQAGTPAEDDLTIVINLAKVFSRIIGRGKGDGRSDK
jgi:DNA-binding transcriptional MerR regulator